MLIARTAPTPSHIGPCTEDSYQPPSPTIQPPNGKLPYRQSRTQFALKSGQFSSPEDSTHHPPTMILAPGQHPPQPTIIPARTAPTPPMTNTTKQDIMQIHRRTVNPYTYSPAQRSHHSWQSRSSNSQSLTTKSRPKQTTSIHQSIRLCWLNRVNRTALKNRHQNSQDSQLHI